MLLLRELFTAAGFICLLLSSMYSVATVAAVAMRRREAPDLPDREGPPVTILKPLCGAEPGLYENLRSFCEQNYGQFQIMFGVRDSTDPALAVVYQLMAEFPNLHMDLAINARQHGSNRKVSNLINMLDYARHDVLVIADSDVLVCADYLSTVTAPLQDDSTGLVTCLYHGMPIQTLWSRLGAMYVNEWYMPSVLMSRLLGERGFASGQTSCLRRETLDALGGLYSIADHLADDYQLGALVRGLGKRIVLSSYVPREERSDPSLDALIQHETRWMQTIRVLRPNSFRFLFITFSAPLAVLGFVMCAGYAPLLEVALVLLLVSLNARILLHRLARRSGDPAGRGELWLVPLRDLLLCWAWLRAFRNSKVTWRGLEFEVDVRGIMRGVG